MFESVWYVSHLALPHYREELEKYLSHANCAHAYGRAISSSGFSEWATLRDRARRDKATSTRSVGSGPVRVGTSPVKACSILALLMAECLCWVDNGGCCLLRRRVRRVFTCALGFERSTAEASRGNHVATYNVRSFLLLTRAASRGLLTMRFNVPVDGVCRHLSPKYGSG